MKKLVVILLLLSGMATTAFAQTVWRELTFEQALEAAKAEGKPIFLDCYTSWCSPCRQMAQRVFPTKEVGDFLNDRFVAIKMDMEKGEGVPLALRYDVTVFPTYLVIDADGKMMHKAIGAIEGEGFINLISAAFDPARGLGARLDRFDAGDRDPDFLRELHSYLLRINDARAKEVQKAK